MDEVSLSGDWELRFDGEESWRTLRVPGCWESLDVPKDRSGPAWYRRELLVPADWAGRRVWLRFGGVSYFCTVLVNGHEVGGHTGVWDRFEVDVTRAVRPGEPAELLVRVEKPASLTRGPDSSPVPGSYPLRQTLSGFLPYVWGHMFGGIWQDVTLVGTGQTVLEDVYVRGDDTGRFALEVETSGPAWLSVTVADPDGVTVYEESRQTSGYLSLSLDVAPRRVWSPRSPDLYTVRVRVPDGDERAVHCGLRSLRTEGSTLLLNGWPLYPRMALSWGWYPDSLHSNPGPERVRSDLLRLRSLGYNGVKLCLWFPPEYYFDVADELGMLIWVELPMWLPDPSSHWRRQVPLEYERLIRQAGNHPSVILYTLGCELGAGVGDDVLGPLYELARSLAGNALVRDNSGSGEAYGGLLNEHAEFYDYHFYSDLQWFRPLLDHFTPRWRREMPWLFGEYCDLDTFRDLRRLRDGAGELPWWTSADPAINPQGARWQYDLPEQEARLRASGLWERGEEPERLSRKQALLHRKWTLETTRLYREVSGYVVTGERDTPISTAGMLDDSGELKFEPAELRPSNADLVLLVGWDRRRSWVAGGDRAAYWDPWSYVSGALVRPHLVASHYGRTSGPAEVEWSVGFDGEPPFAEGHARTDFYVRPGDVRELAVAELRVPAVTSPREATLRATVRVGEETAHNSWPLWCYPPVPWTDVGAVALVDPTGRLHDLPPSLPELAPSIEAAEVIIATVWTPEVERYALDEGRVILLQAGRGPEGPIRTVELPFWREAVRIVEPHPAWGDFPHGGLAGLQLYGCATDYALDSASLPEALPILRRLDARTMRVHDYAAELRSGEGRCIVSTLRLEGGQADQPTGISRSVAAAYLLCCWARYLAES
ncbi:MAG: glycoside hydrolase [Chloroflexota bacterium]|nr:glycoside hydrolase [Chloroflexota bacterium]